MGKSRISHLIITNLIRLILLSTFTYAIISSRPTIQIVSIIAFFVTLIPSFLEKFFKIKVPASAEIIYFMFLYGILTLGELRGFFHGFWWWSLIMTFTASIALGFVSLSIIFTLHKTNRINTNPLIIAILVFSLTLSLATLWEVFEFLLDLIIHSGLQKNLIDTMQDICINILGSLLVAIAGYNSTQTGNCRLASTFLTTIMEQSPKLLGPKRKAETPEKIVEEIIQIGETSKIEFKSTIRTNLYTNQSDKKMELEILKTITAFLNTKGGNLLIGVDDDGKIPGIQNDNFPNQDKATLHIINLIKSHIGNKFLPFIKPIALSIQDKEILFITCKESKTPVFLKYENKEEFYIRNGPASIKLEGSSLVGYINNKFQD